MLYAVFSDVHSNLEAFTAVLDFFKKQRIDRYLFVGDIVGYGADPGPCIDLLKQLDAISVAGNHDWAVAGRLAIQYFNDAAAEAVAWTRERLGSDDEHFLDQLEAVYETKGFCLVHGTLERPREFDYMLDADRANATFLVLKQKYCFVGHTHQPGQWVSDDGTQKIINCGSVGQSRDGDPRACCCIFDTDEACVTWHRIDYDYRVPARKIREAGLPSILADRLAFGR